MGLFSFMKNLLLGTKVEQEVGNCEATQETPTQKKYNYYRCAANTKDFVIIYRYLEDEQNGDYIKIDMSAGTQKGEYWLCWMEKQRFSQLTAYSLGLEISLEEAVELVKNMFPKPDKLIKHLFPEYVEPLSYLDYAYYATLHTQDVPNMIKTGSIWRYTKKAPPEEEFPRIGEYMEVCVDLNWISYAISDKGLMELEITPNNAVEFVKSFKDERYNIEKLFPGYKEEKDDKPKSTTSGRNNSKRRNNGKNTRGTSKRPSGKNNKPTV